MMIPSCPCSLVYEVASCTSSIYTFYMFSAPDWNQPFLKGALVTFSGERHFQNRNPAIRYTYSTPIYLFQWGRSKTLSLNTSI